MVIRVFVCIPVAKLSLKFHENTTVNFRQICRTSAVLEGKEFVGSNFMVKKLLVYHSGGHFLPRI